MAWSSAFGQRGLVDLAAGEFRALVEQRLGAQQAADVLGAERRLQLRQQCFLPGFAESLVGVARGRNRRTFG